MEHPISGVVIAVQYFGMQKRLARSRGVHLFGYLQQVLQRRSSSYTTVSS